MNSIDWAALAERTGALTDTGESGGDQYAKRALVDLLGEDALRDAVAHYVKGLPGSELARSVLWLLMPHCAMDECYRTYKMSDDPEARATAVELLRVVASRDALDWVPGFLADDDPSVQNWGVGVLDQLVCKELISGAEAEPLLTLADQHPSPYVREQAQLIRSVITDREAGDKEAQTEFRTSRAWEE